jgi:serine/threonine protein kinase
MEPLSAIFSALSGGVGAVTGGWTVYGWLVNYLASVSKKKKNNEILEYLNKLGLVSDNDIKLALAKWPMPKGFTESHRTELAGLLKNLAAGARLHSAKGTPASSYLRCEVLIEELISNMRPKRQAGEVLHGGWQLKTFLGMGGFGEVWLAKNPLHPEPRAFKFFTQEGARDWLTQEGKTLFAVEEHLRSCPYVIDYIDVVADGDPYPYLVLEYVGGGSLEDWILTPEDHRVTLDRDELIGGIATGLAEAHRVGICHRDMKPANVLLTNGTDGGLGLDAIPKIADFGLGQVSEPKSAHSSVASQSVLVGTRMYHPPEAADPYVKRDPKQDDVFAVGVIWYQMLVGRLERPPYDFAERLRAAGVFPRAIRMISRCLAHPDHRYASAEDLADALDHDGPGDVVVFPKDCFDVSAIAREYLEQTIR